MAQTFSPRSILLCVVFFFSTNVLAVSAVLGIDLGTEYIKATLVKPGIPLEIVLTKDSRRKETSAVAFKPSQHSPKSGSYPERAYGSDAIALAARFPGDVYPNLKTLLGLSPDDSIVKEYAARHPALHLEAHKTRGTVAFKSDATANEEAWAVEELLAMELQSIQRNAEALAGSDSNVRSVVITVPPFYTVEEKRAIELAADLIGLRVLTLISDGLAVGLNYATSRTFPTINEGGKPEYHMVFDMGAGSAKATIMKFQGRTVKDVGKFNKTVQEIQVVGSSWDRTLGGDALNYLIVDDMISKFVETSAAKKASVTEEGVRGHGRAMAKLLGSAEKLRHVLSANSDTATSFEGLYDDIDFKYKISRAGFEKLAEAHAERVGATVQKALEIAELDIKQLDSIILHGGSSRTPFVQKQLEKIASSDKLRGNVNSDEAAVFGAAFRAAELSPGFRVKEIRISDGSFYPAGMKWTNPQDKPQQQRLWTERSLVGVAPKEVTFTNHDDFSVRFYQQVPSSDGIVTDRDTKVLTTKNLTATVASLVEKGCSQPDIQFKVKLRLSMEDGEVEVEKAAVECEAEVLEKEGSVIDGVKNLFGFGKNKDQQPLKDSEEGLEEETTESASTTKSTETAATSFTESSSSSTAATSSDSAESAESSPIPKKKQLVVVPVDFTLEKAGIPGLPKADLTKAKDRIKAFEASDKSRRLREEALNQLEAFTYKVRDLLDSEQFVAVSTPEEQAKLERKAGQASEWLYDEGSDASREELKSKLKGLKDLVSPIEKRIEESQQRPELVKSLKGALDQTNTFIDTIRERISEADSYRSAFTSSATSDEASSTVTPAPSKGADDFDGLEDEEITTSATATAVDDRVLPPPLYTLEDLKDITDLSKSVIDWLEKKLAEQEELPETADPVLLAKDIIEKTKQLEKAGMDLAMKSVKSFEKNKKKSSSSKKASKSKTKKGSTKTGSDASEPTIDAKDGENYIKFGEDGKGPSAEEIEELIKRMSKEQQNREEAKTKHDEL